MNRIAFLLAAILLSVIGINAPAQTSTELQKLIDQADALQNNGQFEEAITFFEQARQLCETAPGHYTPEMRYIFGSLVSCSNSLGDNYRALEYLIALDGICREVGFDRDSPEYFMCLQIAMLLPFRDATEEELIDAESYINRAGATDDAKLDPDYHVYNECIRRYIQTIRAYHNFTEESISIIETNYRYLSSPGTVRVLGDLYAGDCGNMYLNSLLNLGLNEQCISEAEALLQKFPEMLSTVYGFEALSLETLAIANTGDHTKCIEMGKKIIQNYNLGNQPFALGAQVLYNMALSYNYLGKFNEALDVLNIVYNNPQFNTLIESDKDIFDSEKARSLFELGEYDRCEEICKNILRHNPINDTRLLVNNLMANIAAMKRDRSELGYVEDLVSSVSDMAYDPLKPDVYFDMAIRYRNNYQPAKALEAFDNAIKKYEETEGDESRFNILLAKLYKVSILTEMDEPVECNRLMSEIFNENMPKLISRRIENKNYPEVAQFLQILAGVYYNLLGNMSFHLDAAEHEDSTHEQQLREAKMALSQFYGQAIEFTDPANLGDDFPSWLMENDPAVLGMLYQYHALFLRSANKTSDALVFLDKVLVDFDKECWMYDILVNLKSHTYLALGHISKMEDFISNEFEECVTDLSTLILSFSSQQRKSMWVSNKHRIDWFIELTKDTDLPWLNGIAYNAAVVSKGLLLQADNMFEEKCRNSSDPEVAELYKRWREIFESDPKEAAKIERELVRQIRSDDKQTVDFLNCRWTDVSNRLGKNEFAVEFAYYLDKGLGQYIALVVGNDCKSPKLVRICDSQKLNSGYNGESTDFASLSELVWKPLSEVLPQNAHIYFAPEGMLHALPLENLPDFEDGGRLISDRWELRRVSSTREVANRTSDKPSKNVEIFGGMEYSFSPEAIMADYLALAPTYHRSRDVATDDLRKGTAFVEDLPGSKREVAEIARIVRESGHKAHEFGGRKPTEAKFKSEAGKKGDILHISTHGFYFKPGSADSQTFDWLGQNSSDNMERALYGSGLMMAGVNETLNHNIDIEKCEDGILTAKEISMMDLSGVGTVVLSACETGVGQIFGDGVFGLQRGFKMAGAQTIMMSLWKVDDNATEALMTNFYKNWFAGHDRSTALAMAQKAIRSTPGWESPRYWAGFILLDDLN